ncbi:MAG: HAMP domain-containing histidine kinase [Bacteroidota bacterium]|nr:HAMP domain-containing histidine kinase [Bacteroidota bacterium]
MKDFFLDIFASNFMPHGHCYYWAPEILWSHAISNSIIALAYCAIPLTLIYIFRKRDDFKFIWMMILFAIFILGCGITHIMDVIVIWEPIYRLDALFRIITALASIGTAIVLVRVTPDILKIPSSKQWQDLNKALIDKQLELEETIKALNLKQQELQESNASLKFHQEELELINEELTTNQENLKTSNRELLNSKQELEVVNTELKDVERKLKLSNNELEERVMIRTVELEERNKELVKINNDLDNFIYTASHDLKTPVVNLEGLISLLKNQTKDYSDADIHKILNMPEDSIHKMKETISGLTEIIKVQKNTVDELEKVNLMDIINHVKVDLRENINESNAIIEEEIKVDQILFSKNNVRSILHNLLSNAIKYRSPERQLYIKLSSYYEEEYVVITVQDNGLGIPEKYQSKLFTMFKRLHTHVEGTGIGLYIIKRIVENYKGKVILESEFDIGSTFKIYIPHNS